MLEVAFSRRMCCSRVCSASRSAGWPAASTRDADQPARHAALEVVAGRRRRRRAGRRSPSARRSAAPSRPRRPRPSRPAASAGPAPADRRRRSPAPRRRARPRSPAAGRAPRRSLPGYCSSTRTARRSESVAPVARGDSTRLDAERLGARAPARRRVCGRQSASARKIALRAAGDRVGQRHRLGRGGGLVEQRGVGDLQPGQVAIMVWKFSSASSRPCAISAWYGV